MAVKFGIIEYSRTGNDVTFTLVALNADGTIDTGFTGSFTWGLNGMSDPGTPVFTAADQGQLVFTTTILDPNIRVGLAANFPGNSNGANLSISGPNGTNVSFGNQGDHLLVGGAGNDTITSNNGNDLLRMEQGGNDNPNGGNGDDRFYFGGAYTSADVATGGNGTDRLLLQGDYSAGVTLGSLSSIEAVVLMAGNDTIYDGETGTNLSYMIVADANTTTGPGNLLTIDASALRAGEALDFNGTASAINFTVMSGAGNDAFAGGSGNDTASYADAADGVTVSLALTGAQDTLGAGIDTISGFENLTGSAFADTLTGNAGANRLAGLDGADRYYVQDLADEVLEAAGEGNDRVITSVSWVLGAGSEVETIEAEAGTAAINLFGNLLANVLIGNAGNNVLSGGGGAPDEMIGRGGDDTYVVDNAGDRVIEIAGEGSDTIYSAFDYGLAADQEVEVLSAITHADTAALSLFGNAGDQSIVGNFGNNVLGGVTGADLLYGLAGDDTYVVNDSRARVFENAGGGTDSVYTNVSFALGAGAEVEILSTINHSGTAAISLTGNAHSQLIVGNFGRNVLNGGSGADLLYGLAGDDTYIIHDASAQVFEAAGGGNDLVFTSISYTLGADAEIESLSANSHAGTGALDLTGNALDNTIYGNNGANVLDGKSGADLLVGLGGADSFAFTTALGGGNVDIIFGFQGGVDRIALDDAIFAAAGAPGALNASAFVTGTAAADADDRIIYNSASGALFYDADGNGAGAAVQFAQLSPGLTLTASDFQVI